jgi:benzylsuccinate CoA-transferase BbsF subunit
MSSEPSEAGQDTTAHPAAEALKGLRVLDFGWYVAVPLATRMLRDYGAEVLKVETGEHVDPIRVSPPVPSDASGVNSSLIYHNTNNGKLSVTLNLNHLEGRRLAEALVCISDIVTDNYSPGVMERYGLGYDELRILRPDVIVLKAPMMGLEGASSAWRAMGLGIQHVAGIGFYTGYPDLPPGPIPLSFPDYCVNPYHEVTAIMAALRYRRRTGEGQLVELSQYESTVNFIGPAALDYVLHGRVAVRHGNDSSRFVPHGVFPCAGEDRWIAIVADGDEAWAALCGIMQRDDWLANPNYGNLAGRLEHQDVIHASIAAWTHRREARELMDSLQHAGVPAGVVQTGRDAIENDPQLKARGAHQRVSQPEAGEHLYDTRSALLSKTPGRIQGPAPLLGEHNDLVCQELLGLSEEQVNWLLVDGALR